MSETKRGDETKHGAKTKVGRLAERVRKAVDEGADAAEEIHKKVLNLPLDVLERSGVIEGAARDLRRFQDQTIGAVYDLVRGINHDAVKLATHLLGPAPARKTRPRKHPAKTGVKSTKKTAAA